ncbi:MAG: LysR family transcriptional regulator [Rhodospirillaceae bacterium]|nr:LysR family transcriptional regulator [Rhodospirillaceae bacterium]
MNLRQIEAFKALIEHGTVSRAAEMLNISQPAMSKLIAHLEADACLKLFDRLKGRLAPTSHAMLLYDEVGRIFAGVRQVENAVEAIRREQQGRLGVGVMAALAGSFLQLATTGFLKSHRTVFCSIQSLSSEWIVDRLVARKLDIGLVSGRLDNPYVKLEPLSEHPVVCIMPLGHRLAAKGHIEPLDLHQVEFVAYHRDTYFGNIIDKMFETYGVEPRTVIDSNVAPTLCEFVAAGLGVSLVHPLTLSGMEHRLAVRRFEPETLFKFQLGRSSGNRNAALVEDFANELRESAAQICSTVLSGS